ncbi:MAG: Hsp33 family molecular chaperone HslO [Myxococcales bacterium FL481]|nr:MAG: Hsp33 family molecular chaperone HslO [Myxococcales bacterium FL481]
MDELLRAVDRDQTVRVVAVRTTDTVQEAARRQGLTPSETVALGRAMTAGCLLATLAKSDRERVRLRFQGRGRVDGVLVDARGDGTVRACLKPTLDDENHPLAAVIPGPHRRPSLAPLLGTQGYLVVTRDLGLAQPYEGSSDWVSGEVDEDVEAYLNNSEQLPSAMTCETIVDAGGVVRSAGVLCQGLPDLDPQRIQAVRDTFADGALYQLLHQAREPADLVGFALGGDAFLPMGHHRVRFACSCGPAAARRVLASLGAADLDALAAERPETTVSCSFCGATETLSADAVRALAGELRAERS